MSLKNKNHPELPNVVRFIFVNQSSLFFNATSDVIECISKEYTCSICRKFDIQIDKKKNNDPTIIVFCLDRFEKKEYKVITRYLSSHREDKMYRILLIGKIEKQQKHRFVAMTKHPITPGSIVSVINVFFSP